MQPSLIQLLCLAFAAALFPTGVSASLKQETIACLEATTNRKLTSAMTANKAQALVRYFESGLESYVFKVALGEGCCDPYALRLVVKNGAVKDNDDKPACLTERSQRICAATLLQNLVPANSVDYMRLFTRIGKSWEQLAAALKSETDNIDDDCVLQFKKVVPVPDNLRTLTIDCLQKQMTGPKGLIFALNEAQPQSKAKFSPNSVLNVEYHPASENFGYRNYFVSLAVKGGEARLFYGSTDPEVPMRPSEYAEPDSCDDLAIMRCANQLLFKHARPALGDLADYSTLSTFKTWTLLRKDMAGDRKFVCK